MKLQQQSETLSSLFEELKKIKQSIKKAAPDIPSISMFNQDRVLVEELSQLSISQRNIANEHALLRSLTFPCRSLRHFSIPEAQAQTYEWAFKDSSSVEGGMNPASRDQDNSGTQPRAGIIKWLQWGTGIYWVSGKPGSGKSTFMKYLADKLLTLGRLSKASHAGVDKSIIVSHYFWNAGTPMQKSEEGLLRTLLYEIFRQCPDLISRACDKEIYHDGLHMDQRTPLWSLADLHSALRRIVHAQGLSTRIFFFIDGLDEYDGDHSEICKSLIKLSTSPHISLCLSSRPWCVFEQAFGKGPKLYMQDLTREDILQYCKVRLETHPEWLSIASEPERRTMISEIENRASGVFLWVFLVTQQLRQSLTNRDPFSDLKRRLETFPVELEAFFKRILESVDPFYAEKMSTSLQVAISASGPLHATVYDFLEQEYDDEDYVLKMPNKIYSSKEVADIAQRMAWRLNSRCHGLLEVNAGYGLVQFLHRTVRDFLKTRDMHDFLVAKQPVKYNIHLSLLRAYTATAKTTQFDMPMIRLGFGRYSTPPDASSDKAATPITAPHTPSNEHPLQNLIDLSLSAFEELEISHPSDLRGRKVIDELDKTLLDSPCLNGTHCCFREQIVCRRLLSLIHSRVENDSRYLSDMPTTFITCLLNGGSSTLGFLKTDRMWGPDEIDLLRCIIDTQTLDLTGFHDDPTVTNRWSLLTLLLEYFTSWNAAMDSLVERHFWALMDNGTLSRLLNKAGDRSSGSDVLWEWQAQHILDGYLRLAFEVRFIPSKEPVYLQVLFGLVECEACLVSCLPDSNAFYDEDNIGFSKLLARVCLDGVLDRLQAKPGRDSNFRLLFGVINILLQRINQLSAVQREDLQRIATMIQALFPKQFCERLRSLHPDMPWGESGKRGGEPLENERYKVKKLVDYDSDDTG
ncbi:uncharacterized protein E0L32_000823 [Thyridium curvatum]|uniref:Uncharacterized protein n=1 Tax=Thyridium curvatum TaxID=1093900 RepID=A0A507B0T5_9PEZI|nr:uncharacterized protein E0L32_000823 [Thyridium curvatum]TPX12646.1 hypothetical protein E0L32_000823 [Thyridium curvatum]